MTIIVGRGRAKATQRIEITDPTVSREHCWLTDNGDGTYTLEHKSPNSSTMVEGRKVIKTTVTPDTSIELSPSTTLKVADLLPLAPAAPPPVTEYSIAPLKAVWEEYHEKQLAMQRSQRRLNLWRSASPMFTIGSGTIATLAKTLGWGDGIFGLTLVLTAIGLGLMVYCFVMSVRDKSIEEREASTEEFTRRYVCPNPECRHFMGHQSYHLVSQNKTCPWCKCKFKEMD